MDSGATIRDAAELVQAGSSPAPSAVFSFFRVNEDGERYEFPVRIRHLWPHEHDEITAAAQRHAEKYKEDPNKYRDIYEQAQAVELVARVLCKVDPAEREDGTKFWRRLFVDPDHLRRGLLTTEIAYCLNLYEIVKAKYSPFQDFSPDNIEDWARKLSNPMMGAYFLSQLDSAQWPQALMCMAKLASDLLESQSPEPIDSPDSSEFESENSDPGTTGSTGSPSAYLKDTTVRIPDERLINSQEARAILKQSEKKDSDE